MQQTPKGNQLHIGLFGKRNAGKSTLMNALLNQEISIVSPIAGTTTDIVHKSKEWHPIGPVVFVDTPGLDDEGALGALRIQKAKQMLDQVDLVIWVHQVRALENEVDLQQVLYGESRWSQCSQEKKPIEEVLLDEDERQVLKEIRDKGVPLIQVYNIFQEFEAHSLKIQKMIKMEEPSLVLNARTGDGIECLKEAISKCLMRQEDKKCIGDQVTKGEVVLLVMPQDLQAPKGRLILPQVQILRELLDAQAIPVLTTKETLQETLAMVRDKVELVITDSQIFKEVYNICPPHIPLTSFSILMARQKGDLAQYVEGAKAMRWLKEGDQVLIAESCSHNPLHEDIAREKIPRAIKKKVGDKILFEHVCGNSFPEDLSPYALIIQCGGCMQTPKQIEARLKSAAMQNVPITNFGVALAYLSDILEDIWLPR